MYKSDKFIASHQFNYNISMKPSKNSLNSEMKQLKAISATSPVVINFQRVIAKQQEVIASLHEEILMLKSYISIHKSSNFDPVCSENSIISTNSSNDSTLTKDLEESLSHGHKLYEKALKQISSVLELKDVNDLDDPRLIECIKQLKETAVKKQAPIFVEKIKEIKVPITVEKIIQKPVQRIVEKIVYVEKATFKERPGERYPRQYENEQQDFVLNKTYSDRNLNKTMASYRDDKYQEKYQQKGKYDPYKRNDTGNTLIKRRGEGSKNFTYKKDYY